MNCLYIESKEFGTSRPTILHKPRFQFCLVYLALFQLFTSKLDTISYNISCNMYVLLTARPVARISQKGVQKPQEGADFGSVQQPGDKHEIGVTYFK